jgi:hypothetical protein
MWLAAAANRVVRAFWFNPVAARHRHDGIMDDRVKSFWKQYPFILGQILKSQSLVLNRRVALW